MPQWLKASGYASGDDGLEDRETEEEITKKTGGRKHGAAQVFERFYSYSLCYRWLWQVSLPLFGCGKQNQGGNKKQTYPSPNECINELPEHNSSSFLP